MKKLIERRPAETASGLALAATLYGFLTQDGVPQLWSAIAAAVVGFGPGFISAIVDAFSGG